VLASSGIPKIFFFGGEGVQQIQLRIEGRENGDLGAVDPYSGVPLNLQMSETHILIRLLRMYFFEGGYTPSTHVDFNFCYVRDEAIRTARRGP
jgi:hypothetical protein